ncbi:aldo/keto reductase [Desulfitobacterium sp.]|uniref:aldo/keto reductase n=1 Tax=Desulfitobacterium sp. TaxID=49981 RepID=UPI002B958B7C|nr:aldo/keto reductase [Desulfitobacterium sp.]HVJ50692.1 aldo/keto reductase [Desulfitobacterium sp.]
MQQVKLGWNGPMVSEVCFGSLAVSPLQGRVTSEEGVEVMRYAFERGVNWLDTAEIYANYDQIKMALQGFPEVRVISKSYAVTGQEMIQSIEKARKGLNRDVLDFFLLHEQESAFTLKGHHEAWEELLKAKEKGIVRGIGISTHAVAGVRAGALQPGLDVIHPIINQEGIGIIDGTLPEMLSAIAFAAEMGLGMYAMKVFGGGHLATKPEESLNFVRSIPGIQGMALGMSSKEEVDFNLNFIEGKEISENLRQNVKYRERKLYIADWCQGCGRCVETCPQGALSMTVQREGRGEQAEVDPKACVLCGYCGRVCPHFCLKIV